MMLNLLIVDDEDIVREGLKKYVDWNQLGYRRVFDAESAEKAMKIIEDEHIDVLLTDIIMPNIDGLELINTIKKTHPKIKTVILSGYEDFQYAQKALRLEVCDYLTKPVDFLELKRIFTNIKLIEETEEKEKEKQTEYMNFVTEQFFNNLVKGFFIELKDIESRTKEINLNITPGNFRVIRFYIMEGAFVSEKAPLPDYLQLKLEIFEMVKKHFSNSESTYIFNNEIKEFVGLFFNQDRKGELQYELTGIQDKIKAKFNCITHIGIGEEYSSLLFARDSYNEAGKILEFGLFKKENSVQYYHDITNIKEKTEGRITENAKNYIKEHFNEDINLDKLSKILYVHPIYLSKLFKERMGENYIDYLTRVRIEKSKELLADLSLKIYDVTEMVGYSSSKHFSQVFKKSVGITPKEFRER